MRQTALYADDQAIAALCALLESLEARGIGFQRGGDDLVLQNEALLDEPLRASIAAYRPVLLDYCILWDAVAQDFDQTSAAIGVRDGLEPLGDDPLPKLQELRCEAITRLALDGIKAASRAGAKGFAVSPVLPQSETESAAGA